MITKRVNPSIFFFFVLFCATQPMQNVYNPNTYITYNTYSNVNQSNNADSKPIKQYAHQLAYVTHAIASEETVDFTAFWNEINNKKEISNPTKEMISKKTFCILCCGQNFSTLAKLQTHILKKHCNENKYAARLQNGSLKWYSQADSATCRTIYEHYPDFFKCPECTDKCYATERSLKKHYTKKHTPKLQ